MKTIDELAQMEEVYEARLVAEDLQNRLVSLEMGKEAVFMIDIINILKTLYDALDGDEGITPYPWRELGNEIDQLEKLLHRCNLKAGYSKKDHEAGIAHIQRLREITKIE